MGSILTSTQMRNTYIRLLVERYMNIASKIKKEIVPNKISEDSNEYIANSNVVLGFIMEKYVITNNEKDRISSSELFNDFKSNSIGTKITQLKFKDDMKTVDGVIWKKNEKW